MEGRVTEIFSAAQIEARVAALANGIRQAYGDSELTVLATLEDAFVFLADLSRQLQGPLRIGFLRQSIEGHRDAGTLELRRKFQAMIVDELDALFVREQMPAGGSGVQVRSEARRPGRTPTSTPDGPPGRR